jgi:PDZ domain-containing protein
VSRPEDVVTAVRDEPVGSTLAFTVLRDGQEATVDVVSAEKPDEAGVPYVGITVGINYRAEFPITFALDDIGGPSAGMMFALAIVDKLTPEDLTGGGHVAGTGTIDPAGSVGAIGGIRQKLAGARGAGATLFLLPQVHCEEAAGYVPEGLSAVPVSTLQDALDALAAWRAGEPLPTCPAV